MPTEIVKIANTDLTTKQVDGTGLFDILMSSMHNHLKGEYEKQRITGNEYTKAYIELSSVALNSAIQFLLARDTTWLQALKLELDAKLLQFQLDELLPLQKQLVAAQVASATKDNQIKDYQLANLLPAELAQSTAQTALVNAQKTGVDYNNSNILPQQKVLLQEQAEVQHAQVSDTKIAGGAVTGAVGKQRELYTQQITSYKRDGEVKTAKMFVDAWITMKTMDEGLLPPDNFNNPSLNAILATLKSNNQIG